MKTIPLTNGKVALVDDKNFDCLNTYKWYASKQILKNRTIWYAARRPRIDDKKQTVLMHRQILGVLDTGIKVDHIDGDGLRNLEENIRIASQSQNQQNQRKRIGHSSQFKGVCWHKRTSKWMARIKINGHTNYLGIFGKEEDAAHAYDNAAKQEFGEFALTNF